MKKGIASVLFLFFASLFCAQVAYQPKTFQFKKKKYFVYPLRASDLQSVPPTAFEIPDGDYVIFSEYEFKRNLLLTKSKLRDTSKVAGIFSIKNEIPEGNAEFYSYNYKPGLMVSHYGNKIIETTSGKFINGLKEGLWIQQSDTKSKITRMYHNGLLNGPVMEYDRKGQLYKRESFCNERPCDTVVWYYHNGKPHFSYDVYDDLYDTTVVQENFNDFVLSTVFPDFFLLGKDNKIKTFYKSWRADGTIENNIRFNHHKNPDFDTLYNSTGLKLVIKRIFVTGNDTVHKVETVYGKNEVSTVRMFTGRTEYLYKSYYYNEKTKSRDSVVKEDIPVFKIDATSWKPVQINSYNGSSSGQEKTIMIPAAQYCWTEKNGKRNPMKPAEINQEKKTITVRDTFFFTPSDLYSVKEIVFRSDTDLYGAIDKKGPWKKFDFLNGLSAGNTGSYVSSGEFNVAPYKTNCRNYYGLTSYEKHFRKSNPCNGKLIIAPAKSVVENQTRETEVIYSDKLFSVFSVYNFKDGLKDGKAEVLLLLKSKKLDGSAENVFFQKSKQGDTYMTLTYKEGKLNGNFRLYGTYNAVTRIYNRDSTKFKVGRKLQRVLIREENYLNGKLNGPAAIYLSNGKPQTLANYKNGKLDGKAEFYWSDGKLRCKAEFSDDKLNGDYSEWDGHKTMQASFRDNNLEGKLAMLNSGGKEWLNLLASKNLLRTRRLYFENGIKKDELIFDTLYAPEFSHKWLSSETWLEIASGKDYTDFYRASYSSYFENGMKLCEGNVVVNDPKGKWNFYNVAGTLINQVVFTDTFIVFPNGNGGKKFIGKITGYFNDSKIRFKGYISSWESGYDCASHQDKTKFTITYTDCWNYNGVQIMNSGNGKGIIYDENGMKLCEGELKDGREEGIWKYYDQAQHLAETGRFVKGQKAGLWYIGDLENINFEDGACFDANNSEAQKVFERSKKQIKVSTELYKDGILMDTQTFETNLNTTAD